MVVLDALRGVRVAFAGPDQATVWRDGLALPLSSPELRSMADSLLRGDDPAGLITRRLTDSGQALTRDPPGAVPLVIGAYVVVAPLGRGASSVVVEAVDTRSGEHVALKILYAPSPRVLAGFKGEARSLVDASHPALVIPDEILQLDGLLALVQPLVRGQDYVEALRAAAGDEGPLADERAARALVVGLVDAVRALHQRGLLHRDLKPSNVLVDEGGQVRVLDFGLAFAEGFASPDELREVVGTPLYMAPEVLAGTGAVGEPCDAFGVGAMLFEGLCGRGPFDYTGQPVMARTLMPPEAAASARPALPEDLARAVDGLLAPDPRDRLGLDDARARLDAVGAPLIPGLKFAGRDGEVARLHALWNQVSGGPSALLLLRGPAGLGKTTLSARLVTARLRAGDAHVLAGRCFHGDGVPFRALDAVLDRLAHVVRASAHEDWVATHADFGHLVRILPVFRVIGEADPVGGPAELSYERAVGLLQGIVARLAAERPVLLVIDDAHWGDADSADLLSALLSTPGGRVMALLAAREPEWAGSPLAGALGRRLRKGPSFLHETLDLEPLGADASFAALSGGAGDPLSPRLRERVVAEAAGRPGMLALLAQDAADGTLDGPDAFAAARLASIAPEHRAFVRALALAPSPLWLDVVARAADVAVPSRAALAQMRAAELLWVGRRDGDRVALVAHEAVRAALVAELSPSCHVELHTKIGEALLSRGGDVARAAWHLLQAGDADRVAPLTLRSAEEAWAVGAFDRAAEALILAQEAGVRRDAAGIDLRVRLARALVASGRGREAGPIFLGAAQDAPAAEADALRLAAGDALLQVGAVADGLAALAPLMKGQGVALPTRGPALIARLGTDLGWLLWRGRRPPAVGAVDRAAAARADTAWVAAKGLVFVEPALGLDYLLRSLRHAYASGDAVRAGRAMGPLAGFLLGQLPLLSRVAARWLAWMDARSGDSPYLAAAVDLWRGLSAVSVGALEEATARGRRAMDALAADPELNWERGQAASFLVRALATRGDLLSATGISQVELRDAERAGDLYRQVLFGTYLALPAIARGLVDEARELADWIEREWLPGQYTVQSFYVMLFRAYADLYEGRPALAARRVVDGRAAFRKAGGYQLVFSRIEHHLLEARVGMALAEPFPGLLAPAAIADRLRKERVPEGAAHAALIDASLAAAHGDEERAIGHLERAIGGYERATLALDGHVATAAMARLLDHADPDAEPDALAGMRRLGVAEAERWCRMLAPPLFAARRG